MWKKRAAVRAGLGAVAVGVLLAAAEGCGGSGHGAATLVRPTESAAAATRSGIAPVPSANPTTQPSLFLPIAKYSLSPADALLLDRAKDVVVGDCMARFGFSWASAGHVTLTPGENQDRRYGVTAAADVAVNGYHPPVIPSTPRPKKSPDERLALIGPEAIGKPAGSTLAVKGHKVPLGGCQGEARRALSGDVTALPGSAVASGISGESYERSKRDPAVRRVFAAWSRCMKTKGFSYPDPIGAAAGFTGATASSREKKVAVADVACKEQTNLVTVWFAADARLQRTLIAPQAAVLAAVLTRHQQEIARARAITKGRRPPAP